MKTFFLVVALIFVPQLALAGSKTFSYTGSTQYFTVPSYGTLTVILNAAGGGGGAGKFVCSYYVQSGNAPSGSPGENSSFGTLTAYGGGGGTGASASTPGTTGYANDGNSGQIIQGGGGAGGAGGTYSYCTSTGGAGGGGGKTTKTYTAGALTPGASITVYVGGGGGGGGIGSIAPGGSGQNGSISITWTDPTPLQCNGTPEIYSTPGTYTRSIPTYYSMIAEVWGAGASGGGAGGGTSPGTAAGSSGGQSSFSTTVAGGGIGSAAMSLVGGAGGTASLGDTNTPGSAGGSGSSDLCPVPASGSGGSAPNGSLGNGGAGGLGVGNNSVGNTGFAPGGGGSGGSAVVYVPQQQTYYCRAAAGGGGGAYAKKTYSSGALTPGNSVNIVVGAGGAPQTAPKVGGSGASGSVIILCSATPPPPPTLTISAVSPQYVGQPFNVTATFTAGAGDTLVNDNIDGPKPPNGARGGLGIDTSPTTPKVISFSTSSPGTATFYATAKTNNYNWTDYQTLPVTILMPAAPSATISSSLGSTMTTGQTSIITATYTAAAHDTLAEDNIDGDATNPQFVGGLGQDTLPTSPKTYSFHPTVAGVYTFLARERTNAYSWGTYASVTVTVNPACSPAYTCTDSTHVHNSCTGVDTACASGLICSNGSNICVNPPAPAYTPTGTLTGHLQAIPGIVHSGDTTKLYWNVSNVDASTCDVHGSNNDDWPDLSTSGSSGKTTGTISQQTTYTLSCTGLDGTPLYETTKVNIVPGFQEL